MTSKMCQKLTKMCPKNYHLMIVVGLMSLILILFTAEAFGFSITVKNDTGFLLRIDKFKDNCGNVYIERTRPLYLDIGESLTFDGILPIIHHFRMCANGTCEVSAIGVNRIVNEYTLKAILKDRCTYVIVEPLIWPGNVQCFEANFQNL